MKQVMFGLGEGELVSKALQSVSRKFVCQVCGTEYSSEKKAALCVLDCTN